MMFRASVLIGLVSLGRAVSAQEPDSLDIVWPVSSVSWEESVLEGFTGEDASFLAEELAAMRENPVDLNRAREADLERIPGFSQILVQEIVERRNEKPFKSTRELLTLSGMNRDLFVRIRDFVMVGDPSRAQLVNGSIRQRSKRSVEETRDFKSGAFDGNIFQLYERINIVYLPEIGHLPSEVRAGLVFEKDPGERSLSDHRVGFVEFRNVPLIRQAVLGNYQLAYGQGLVLWGSSALGKSNEAVDAVRKKGRGARAYTYATENQAFQGIALTPASGGDGFLSHVELTGFYSYTHRDASFNQDGTVNGLQTDGLHRNALERSRENYLLETLGGANVEFRTSRGSVGATFYAQQFDRYFVINDSVRNRFDFRGGRHAVGGIHFEWGVEEWASFGEFAVDRRSQKALLTGIYRDSRNFDFIVVYRQYDRDYQNLHAFGFGEQNGKTQNERGLYTGIKWKPVRGRVIQSYYDLYRFPWRSFDVPQSVSGDDFMIQWSEDLTRRNNLTFVFKNERKDQAVHTTDEFDRDVTVVEQGTTRRLRSQWTYLPLSMLRLRTRVENSWSSIQQISDRLHGLLLFEDFRCVPTPDLTVQARITYFDSDPGILLYEYENDVEGVFSNAVFSGRGRRWYIMAGYKLNRHLRVAMKYWEMVKDGVENIGSGGDTIHGNRSREITVSMDASF